MTTSSALIKERVREYEEMLSWTDKEFKQKFLEKELNESYKDHMEKGCRIFTNQLENINNKSFILDHKHSLNDPLKKNDSEIYGKSKYFYTGCPELEKFINEFNSKNESNQIHLDKKLQFVNKISVNANDIKNGNLNYNLSYDVERITDGYGYTRGISSFDYPSKDNVFFG
jgi:hypothetical protein